MESDKALLYITEVISTYDENDGGRIKVRISPYDLPDTPIEELPYVFPLLPKHLHVNPKIGELVLVIFQKQGAAKSDRFYIGPIISQPYDMDMGGIYTGRALLNGCTVSGKPQPRVDMDPENAGTVPERDDIAIEGRKNSDIVLKDNEVRIRCGHKEEPDSTDRSNRLHRNRRDPAYIQMKFDRSRRMTSKSSDDRYSSSVNVVADRINLLSHDSPDNFELTDPNELISENTMSKIMREAHQMVYGDELVKYLKKLVDIFEKHTHPFAMDPPCLDSTQKAAINTSQLDGILSNSIRIN